MIKELASIHTSANFISCIRDQSSGDRNNRKEWCIQENNKHKFPRLLLRFKHR